MENRGKVIVINVKLDELNGESHPYALFTYYILLIMCNSLGISSSNPTKKSLTSWSDIHAENVHMSISGSTSFRTKFKYNSNSKSS